MIIYYSIVARRDNYEGCPQGPSWLSVTLDKIPHLHQKRHLNFVKLQISLSRRINDNFPFPFGDTFQNPLFLFQR